MLTIKREEMWKKRHSTKKTLKIVKPIYIVSV